MNKPRFKYFCAGETPLNSGIVILKQLKLTTDQRMTRYRVRYLCCNTEVDMAHKSIMAKIARVNKGCRSCTINVAIEASARKRRPSQTLVKARTSEDLTEDYDIIQPPWAPASWMVGFDVPFIYAGAA